MAEAKKKPTEQVGAPRVVGVTYMMLPTGTKASETPLFEIRRVEFDGEKVWAAPFEAVRPAPRLIIRERMRVLLESREVLP